MDDAVNEFKAGHNAVRGSILLALEDEIVALRFNLLDGLLDNLLLLLYEKIDVVKVVKEHLCIKDELKGIK